MYNNISVCVVLKPLWHELTNWRHIDEVKHYYPGIYKEWCNKGYIPKYIQAELEEGK